jgi:hypothetical protein
MKNTAPILITLLAFLGSTALGCGHAEGLGTGDGEGVFSDEATIDLAPAQDAAPPEPAPLDYDRKQWRHWTDEDRDCQNTRQELLLRDTLVEVTFKDKRRCKVETGLWTSVSTGIQWRESRKLDADHIVPLKWAHVHGGQGWTPTQKRRFANDLDNLQLIERGQNTAKGARGPSQWLPSEPEYVCDYIHKFETIVSRYKLIFEEDEAALVEKAKSGFRCRR